MHPEQRIADRFTVEAEAGRGGMGVVYRARDALDGGLVALKLLEGRDAVDLARFEREARLLARLSHPNVVRYVDHGHTPDGHVYLAMEWLAGETLAERSRHTMLDAADAVRVIRAAAAGLGAAHAAGIVHRDVKPANLFLVEGGGPDATKVLDFGIARPLGPRDLVLTSTGTVMGTPFYMAPEQARAATHLDARADVYALGAVLYELLTGRPPFAHETLMALLAAILLEEPVDVREHAPETPEPLAALVTRLLDKRPENRPADGSVLVAALDALGVAPRSAPRALPPALTEREQRVLCLVLATGATSSHATTLVADGDDSVGRLRAVVEAQGEHLEALADGSLIARIEPRGTPTEQAVRAARCALAMRAVAPELPLAAVAGRGMFRGPVPVGEVIDRASTLLGRTPAFGGAGHKAAFGGVTQKHGELGGSAPRALPVRLDDVMAGLLEPRFEIHRGAHGATLGEPRAPGHTARTLLGRAVACVGRARELALLEGLYAECVEEPIARVALISAPAGGGKTRLLSELVDRLARDGTEVWIARGDPLGAGSTFGVLAQLVRHAAAITEGEPLAHRQAKLRARVERALGANERVIESLGAIARTPFDDARGSLPPDDPQLRGDAMREAFLAWLGAELASHPVVLVIDDLQWGDRPSLAFVSAALRDHARRPLLVLAAGRPEASELYADVFEERGAFGDAAQLVRLAPLTPRASETLVRQALGDDADAALVSRLVERADGNPFFLEELVRAVGEGRREGPLPTTVLGMIEARLAELEASTRRVLRAGSVFGRRFFRDGVIELLGGADRAGDVDAHLAVLGQREILDRVSAPRLLGQVEHAFRTALTREAAYAMLTDEDRRLGHRLAAAWLEQAGEHDPRVLAEHHARGDDMAAAAHWLGRAAEDALEGHDSAAAIELGERALSGASTEARGAILVTLADAHRWRGEYPEAFARAVEAADALTEGTRPWFRAVGVLFAAAGRIGRASEAEAWRERVARIEAAPGAVGAQVVALCRAATLALSAGDAARFEATLGRAQQLAEAGASGEALPRAWILTLRASWALRAGDHGAFVDGTAEAVAAYEAAGDPRDACNQRVRLGNGYVGLGDPARAELVLRDALAGARRMGLPLIEGYALQNLGHALLRQGHVEAAIAAEEQAIAVATRLGDAVLEAGSLLYLAEARERAGQPSAAVEDARRAVALLERVPPFQAVARAILARALSASGADAEALTEIERACAGLEAQPLEEGEALVRAIHVDVLRACGRLDEAHAEACAAWARVEARAASIADLGWRDAFLHRVPHHARLFEQARS